MQPRYQIFVSSTFRDLVDERRAVLEAILELNHFPAGMEIFPASDATPWDLIKSVIAESDYYVLVIGGRYGSAASDGISYTEKEYRYAVEFNKPVLAFLHAAPDEIPVGKSEMEPQARKRLAAFRTKVEGHHCKYWRNANELKAAVVVALTHAIRVTPGPGWVRADGIDSLELLKRLSDLQDRYGQLERENAALRESQVLSDDLSELSKGGDTVNITFALQFASKDYQLEFTWDEIFFGIAEAMLIPASDAALINAFKPVLFGAFHSTPEFLQATAHNPNKDYYSDHCIVSAKSLQTVTVQLMALGLIEPETLIRQRTDQVRGSHTSVERAWKLTSRGRRAFTSRHALRLRNRAATT